MFGVHLYRIIESDLGAYGGGTIFIVTIAHRRSLAPLPQNRPSSPRRGSMAEPLAKDVSKASGVNRHAHARRTRLSGAATLVKGSSISRRFDDHEDGRLSLF